MVMAMIGLGRKTIPGRVKLFFCLAVTVAVMPALPPAKVGDLFSLATTLLVGEQMVDRHYARFCHRYGG